MKQSNSTVGRKHLNRVNEFTLVEAIWYWDYPHQPTKEEFDLTYRAVVNAYKRISSEMALDKLIKAVSLLTYKDYFEKHGILPEWGEDVHRFHVQLERKLISGPLLSWEFKHKAFVEYSEDKIITFATKLMRWELELVAEILDEKPALLYINEQAEIQNQHRKRAAAGSTTAQGKRDKLREKTQNIFKIILEEKKSANISDLIKNNVFIQARKNSGIPIDKRPSDRTLRDWVRPVKQEVLGIPPKKKKTSKSPK